MGRIKSCLKGNINGLDVTTTEDAISSLNSAKWFVHKSGMSAGFIVTFSHILW